MSTCPKCGAENFINTCENCGFEQTNYKLTRLGDEDLSLFDTEERLISQCAKQLEQLNGFIRERGSKNPKVHDELAALWDGYIHLRSQKAIDEYSCMSAEQLCELGLEYTCGTGGKERDLARALEILSMAAKKAVPLQ